MLSRASLGDNLVIQFTAFRRKVLRVARKASRSIRLSCALGRQRDALNAPQRIWTEGTRSKPSYPQTPHFAPVLRTL